jgi:hypothetical protein
MGEVDITKIAAEYQKFLSVALERGYLKDYVEFRCESRRDSNNPVYKEWSEEYKWDLLPRANALFLKGGITASNVLDKIEVLQKHNPQKGSFVHWSNLDNLHKLAKKSPERIAALINSLFEETTDLSTRIDNFYKEASKIEAKPKLGTPFFGYIMAVYDCNRYPLYKGEVLNYLKDVLGKKIEWKSLSTGSKYEIFSALCFLMGEYLNKNSLLKEVTVKGIEVTPGNIALDGQDFLYVTSVKNASKDNGREPMVITNTETTDVAEKYNDYRNKGQIEFITFHPAYSYEEFIEGITVKTGEENEETESISYKLKPGIFKEMCKRALVAAIGTELKDSEGKDKSWKDVYGEYVDITAEDPVDFKEAPKHVLIIDEINRGDMAKIFGELITLLEEDKRLGSGNELVVKLPNSGDDFCIPPNLYMIATMNTADRSIALIDVALRRRFGFVEMMPKMDLVREKVLNKLGEDVGALLEKSLTAIEKINMEIAKDATIGRDKQIGHSFFFKVKKVEDLAMVWRYEIFPLLEEYCYADYGRINELVFGAADGSNYIDKTMGIQKIDTSNLESMLDSIINTGQYFTEEEDGELEEQ